MPRIPPISSKEQVAAEHRDVADDVVGVFGRIRGPFSVFLNSPKLASHMLGLVKFNRNVFEAAHFANAVAALSVTQPGTATAMPTAREISRFLRKRDHK